MAEHANATTIRNIYSSFTAGDVPAVLARFTPDLVFHVAGDGPLAGEQKGHDGLLAVLGSGRETSGGTQRFEVRNVFADADHAVAHVRETATRASDGAALDVEEVHLVRLDADGLIAEFWDIPADPDAHDAFFDGR